MKEQNDTNSYMIAYICDGYDVCSMQPGCIMRADTLCASDWVCNHTTNPKHAKTAICNNPEYFPERFARYDGNDGVIRYFEKEPGDEI